MNQAVLEPSLSKEHLAGKYLTFQLGNEHYGVPVLRIREIMGMQHITPVPHTPDHVCGVINLRGKVIPVVDMRRKLGFPSREADKLTCIVVVNVSIQGEDTLMGVVVDAVTEVQQIAAGEIEDTPSFGSGVEMPFLLGVARSDSRVRLLLDIDCVLATEGQLFKEDNGGLTAVEALAAATRNPHKAAELSHK